MARIFFYTRWREIDPAPTAGGPAVLQQHVAILREAGHEVQIVLAGEGDRKGLLGRLGSGRSRSEGAFLQTVGPEDFVVVGAINAADVVGKLPGRKILLNQNGQFLSRSTGDRANPTYPWHSPDLEGIICVSGYDADLMELFAPNCPVFAVANPVDVPDRESLPIAEREALVVTAPLLPYKNPWHTETLTHLIVSRARARQKKDPPSTASRMPTVRVLQGLPRSEALDLLSKARMLIFLSIAEGFGLLPLEAAALGTPVLAYRGQPYGEFLPDAYLHEVGDFRRLVETAEQLLSDRIPDHLVEARAEARERASRYTTVLQRETVLQAYGTILSG